MKTRQKSGKDSYRRGLWAEFLCWMTLWLCGYSVLARRYRTPMGEIDMIARHGDTLVFVEVKARPTYTEASEAIRPAQRDRLKRAAACYLSQHPKYNGLTLRFDALLVCPKALPWHIVSAWDFSCL
jgi:putative endonuclease